MIMSVQRCIFERKCSIYAAARFLVEGGRLKSLEVASFLSIALTHVARQCASNAASSVVLETHRVVSWPMPMNIGSGGISSEGDSLALSG